MSVARGIGRSCKLAVLRPRTSSSKSDPSDRLLWERGTGLRRARLKELRLASEWESA